MNKTIITAIAVCLLVCLSATGMATSGIYNQCEYGRSASITLVNATPYPITCVDRNNGETPVGGWYLNGQPYKLPAYSTWGDMELLLFWNGEPAIMPCFRIEIPELKQVERPMFNLSISTWGGGTAVDMTGSRADFGIKLVEQVNNALGTIPIYGQAASYVKNALTWYRLCLLGNPTNAVTEKKSFYLIEPTGGKFSPTKPLGEFTKDHTAHCVVDPNVPDKSKWVVITQTCVRGGGKSAGETHYGIDQKRSKNLIFITTLGDYQKAEEHLTAMPGSIGSMAKEDLKALTAFKAQADQMLTAAGVKPSK